MERQMLKAEKQESDRVRLGRVYVRFYSIRPKGRHSYSKRKIKASVARLIQAEIETYSSGNHLRKDQLASFLREASSQIQDYLALSDIVCFEGYNYMMHIYMVVYDDSFDKGKLEITLKRVFFRNFSGMIRDRGELSKPLAWDRILGSAWTKASKGGS